MDWFRSSVPAVKLIRTNSTSSQNDSDRENILETVTESIRDHPSSPFLREFSNYATRADRGMVGTEGKVVKSNLEKRDDLTCVLCGELYADPRLLPCLHSFCRRCLEHTINPRSTQLTCHLCRKEVTMKINGVLEFPTNFVINNMLDIHAVRNSSSKPVLCSICSEQLPATARCIDCMDFLCYACHSAHSRVRMTKDHQILTLEQLKRSEDMGRLLHRPVFCQNHSSEKVSFFCNTCQQTICRECVVSNHQNNSHDFLPIEQAIEIRRNELTSLFQVTQQKEPMLSASASDLEEILNKIDARYDQIRSGVQMKTPQLIDMIREKERNILSKLTCVVEEKKNILKKQLDQLQQEHLDLGMCNEFAEQVLQTGTDPEVLTLQNSLCYKLKELAKTKHSISPEADDQIYCDTSIEMISNAVENYGDISPNDSDLLKCSVSGDIGNVVKGHTSNTTLVVRNQQGLPCSCAKELIEAELRTPESGIIVPEIREKSEGMITLSYRTYSVGQHQLCIKYKGKPIFGSPFPINVISDKQTKATPYSVNQFSSSNGLTNIVELERTRSVSPVLPQKALISYSQTLTLQESDNSIDGPQGHLTQSSNQYHDIEIANERDAVLCQEQPKVHFEKKLNSSLSVTDKEKKKGSINENALYSSLGYKFILSFGKRGTHFGEFHGVFGLATDHTNKRILATDCNNHRVQVFDENGHFLFSFGQKGYGDGEFQSPTGIGVGPNGEIIVCERLKGRIQVFNKDGVFQRRFILNELKASTLTVDAAGRIIMADYTNCCIYILDPILERWSRFGHFGQGPGELQYPGYVATDRKGNIYVSDMHTNRVQMFDGDSGFIRCFGSKGDKDGEFLRPTGIAIDTQGRLIVADRDNHRIQVLLESGEFYTKFGSKGDHESDLNDTHGVAVLSDGKIAAADFRNNRIQIFLVVAEEE